MLLRTILALTVLMLVGCTNSAKLMVTSTYSVEGVAKLRSGAPAAHQEVRFIAVYPCQLIWQCSTLVSTVSTDGEGRFFFNSQLSGNFILEFGEIGEKDWAYVELSLPVEGKDVILQAPDV